jgi:hypothetical protein
MDRLIIALRIRSYESEGRTFESFRVRHFFIISLKYPVPPITPID